MKMESKEGKKGSCDQKIGHWHPQLPNIDWTWGYWFAITLNIQIGIAADSDRQERQTSVSGVLSKKTDLTRIHIVLPFFSPLDWPHTPIQIKISAVMACSTSEILNIDHRITHNRSR